MPALKTFAPLDAHRLVKEPSITGNRHGRARHAAPRQAVHHAETSLKRQPGRLSPNAAFYLQSSLTVSFLAGSAAPTPIYPLYQAQWGFSPLAISMVFGIYVVAVLAALLVTGRLSDHIGRRPVLLVAVVAQVLAMVMFAAAGNLSDLLVARVIQGLSTGAAVAAVGAGLLDLNKARGTTANAVVPALGTAAGGILAGLVVHFLPAPMHLVYVILGGIFILQGLGVVFMGETISRKSGAVASLKPQVRLPAAVRTPFLLAVPALVSSWALAGFYSVLSPAVIRTLLGDNAASFGGPSLLGGLSLFVLAGSAALAIYLLRDHSARAMTTFGAATLLVGVAVTGLGLLYGSISVFFFATAVAGAGFGLAFQGAVRSIVPIAAPHERAGVLSLVFVVAYLALAVPALIAGFLLARKPDILATASEFGLMEMVLAGLALLGVLMSPTTSRARASHDAAA